MERHLWGPDSEGLDRVGGRRVGGECRFLDVYDEEASLWVELQLERGEAGEGLVAVFETGLACTALVSDKEVCLTVGGMLGGHFGRDSGLLLASSLNLPMAVRHATDSGLVFPAQLSEAATGSINVEGGYRGDDILFRDGEYVVGRTCLRDGNNGLSESGGRETILRSWRGLAPCGLEMAVGVRKNTAEYCLITGGGTKVARFLLRRRIATSGLDEERLNYRVAKRFWLGAFPMLSLGID